MPSESQALATAPPQSPGLLEQVIAAAKDPSIDAGKMEALVKLVNSQQDREREIEFNRDLNAAMMQMPVITKEGIIKIAANRDKGTPERTQGRFARFEDIDRVCRPILQQHNLAVRFEVGEVGGTISVRPIISHANGHTERGEAMKLPLDTSGGKNNTQGAGSAVTYGKRYTYCAILNIITEGVDDDGSMGRGQEVILPHEREQLVLQEAEAAHEAGRYIAYFGTLGPKDRGWLIQTGHHERFGGQVALPKRTRAEPDKPRGEDSSNGRADDPPPPVDQKRPAVDQPGTGSTGRRPLSAREWVDRFKADLLKCQAQGFLDEFMEGKRDKLDKLKASDEALWEETQQAYRDRRDAITDGRLM